MSMKQTCNSCWALISTKVNVRLRQRSDLFSLHPCRIDVFGWINFLVGRSMGWIAGVFMMAVRHPVALVDVC